MSKTMGHALSWAMGLGAATTGILYKAWEEIERDQDAYREHVLKPNLTHRREVWRACIAYHKGLRKQLAEAQAKNKAGEDIVRVATGLMGVRKMLEGEPEPIDWRKMSMEIPEGGWAEVNKWLGRKRVYPPPEVSNAIVAHWWEELMRLFVYWGVLLPDEIEAASKPFFRLTDPSHTEALLRAEVFKLKELRAVYEKQIEANAEREKAERAAWEKERAELKEEIRMLRETFALPSDAQLQEAFEKRRKQKKKKKKKKKPGRVAVKHETPEPFDELERGLAQFAQEHNDFLGDDVRAILQRTARLRKQVERAAAFEERFRRHLEAAIEDPSDAREFARLLNLGMEYFGLTDMDMAKLAGVSHPTVIRWRAGVACPHPPMRRPTYRVLLHLTGRGKAECAGLSSTIEKLQDALVGVLVTLHHCDHHQGTRYTVCAEARVAEGLLPPEKRRAVEALTSPEAPENDDG